ncbi:MAG TPA: hypothetical protein VFN68_14380 [Acidimicrobiales bacterium]|nr:hypothetical protein [Acidimicrobiales bacterium]
MAEPGQPGDSGGDRPGQTGDSGGDRPGRAGDSGGDRPGQTGDGGGRHPAGGFAEAEFLAALTGWAAGQRVAGAAAARARLRALSESAAGSATFTGVLVDLAERAADVTVSVRSGPEARLSGRLVGVGRDFCVLEQPDGRPVLIRLDAVATVAPNAPSAPGHIGPAGDRAAPLTLSLVAALAELAAERAPVRLATGSERLDGELASVGDDVVTVRVGRSPGRLVHVAVGALRWCELR